MKLVDKVLGGLGLVDKLELEEDQKFKSDDVDFKSKKNTNVVNLHASQKQMKVMVVEPLSFDDAQQIADYLKNRKPVVVNFENTDKEVAKRMIDFISGTTYALGGSIQKVGNNIFFSAPNNVDVTYSTNDDSLDKTFFPWSQNK